MDLQRVLSTMSTMKVKRRIGRMSHVIAHTIQSKRKLHKKVYLYLL